MEPTSAQLVGQKHYIVLRGIIHIAARNFKQLIIHWVATVKRASTP